MDLASSIFSSKWLQEVIVALHVLGLVGAWMYISEVGYELGGLGAFFDALASESYIIRQSEVRSIGTQLSYFGWIAIGLTALASSAIRLRVFVGALTVAQFLSNLAFIDRTRPIWILFTAIVITGLLVSSRQSIRFAWKLVLGAVVSLGIFLAIAAWVGKIGEGVEQFGHTELSGPIRILYMYSTTGFPYFNALTEIQSDYSYFPERLLYPILKPLSDIGVIEAPPSQILDFLNVPYPTNVGTLLEPFYSDGGPLYVVFGILLCSFGVDWLAFRLLRIARPVAAFAWANLCFASFIGFFVPKMFSVPVWLFLALGLSSGYFAKLAKRARLAW